MPYNIRPMTTVGSDIKLFRLISNSFLPPNSFKATIIPSGMPIKEAIKTAVNETFKEVITMLKSAASISRIRLKEEIIASKKNLLLPEFSTVFVIARRNTSSFALI